VQSNAGYLFDGASLQNKRNSNMDSLLLRMRTIGGQKTLIAVVCDGVGSTEDGAYAASTAARMLSEWFGALENTERVGLRMRDAISVINNHIASSAKADKLDTASTLSALLLADGKHYIVHAGDSRIYCLHNGTLLQLTKDDTSETGKLTSCIGRKENIDLFYSEGAADERTFLLCSDGLYN
jgi:serine/threonine protein phosphatase PrpC